MSASGADNRRPQVFPWYQGLFSVRCTLLRGQQPGCSAPGRVRGGVSAQTYVIRLFLPAGVVRAGAPHPQPQYIAGAASACCAYTQRTYPNGHALRDRVPTASTGPSRPLLHMRLKAFAGPFGVCYQVVTRTTSLRRVHRERRPQDRQVRRRSRRGRHQRLGARAAP